MNRRGARRGRAIGRSAHASRPFRICAARRISRTGARRTSAARRSGRIAARAAIGRSADAAGRRAASG
ncbi:hypothetical protein WI23_04705 [Burkholderia oklahomensis C6786]|nr:hypothetical protein WI23_04705 [Burkholderia oklahomensis C6786]KUY47750.1 hypothetical protein WI23_28775 [Burkholderia oklahomensis C6786]